MRYKEYKAKVRQLAKMCDLLDIFVDVNNDLINNMNSKKVKKRKKPRYSKLFKDVTHCLS